MMNLILNTSENNCITALNTLYYIHIMYIKLCVSKYNTFSVIISKEILWSTNNCCRKYYKQCINILVEYEDK